MLQTLPPPVNGLSMTFEKSAIPKSKIQVVGENGHLTVSFSIGDSDKVLQSSCSDFDFNRSTLVARHKPPAVMNPTACMMVDLVE